MVGQVKIVGILMIVHGVTAILMGAFYAVLGPLVAFAGPPPAAGGGGPGGPGGPPPGFQAIVTGVYVGMGILTAIPGLLNLIAGIRLLKYRGRVFAIVALFTNILALASCYCSLTAIGMMIYGLIVLFNSDVAWAFEAVAQGRDPRDVVAKFNRRYGDERDDFDEHNRTPRYGEERRTRWDDEDEGRRPRDYDRE